MKEKMFEKQPFNAKEIQEIDPEITPEGMISQTQKEFLEFAKSKAKEFALSTREYVVMFIEMEDELRERLKKDLDNATLRSKLALLNTEKTGEENIGALNFIHENLLSQFDALTQIPNRRRCNEVLDKFYARAENKKAPKPLSVIMFDIDHFKRVNDTCGHNAGDVVLHAVAQKAKEQLRETEGDFIARTGGEEFTILLHANAKDAQSIAERIRSAIETLTVPYENVEIDPKISLGVQTYVSGLSKEDLLKNSDMALYFAKGQMSDGTEDTNGRNRVAFYDTELDKPRLYIPKEGTE